MKFASILKRARTLAAEADISQVDFLAVQINIEGEENGVFYVEVKDGRISVEPYEYYDRQCAVTISDAEAITEAINTHRQFISSQVLANSITTGETNGQEIEIDGVKAQINVEKV